MPYCIYLRKSRADAESEERGEGETLARHERILLDLAKRQNLTIVEIYKEIVSGDTISSRPIVQKLLSDVEEKLYDGVLVADIDRLARGDTIDQGIVAQAFKYSNTKIITPSKTYDPNNEFDEEYFEFGLFMARREYKIITRRLQRGREVSAKEGKFTGSIPPYGYDKIKLSNQKGFSLNPNKEQAEIIQMIFNWFVYGEIQSDGSLKKIGTTLIARRLNLLNSVKTWLPAAIKEILINPVYMGKIRWKGKPEVKKSVRGKVKKTRVRKKIEDCILSDGFHEAIIDEKTWYLAQKYLKENGQPPVKQDLTVKNPLAGLVYCGKCGRSMIRHVYRQNGEQIICPHIKCKNTGCMLSVLERKVISALKLWLENYKIDLESRNTDKKFNSSDFNKAALQSAENELTSLNKQSENIHDLLERGIYDTDKFLERSKIISDKINKTKKNIESVKKLMRLEVQEENRDNVLIPKIENIIEIYNKISNPEDKNNLLKEVIDKIVYTRESGGRWVNPENFNIDLYPKIPH